MTFEDKWGVIQKVSHLLFVFNPKMKQIKNNNIIFNLFLF